MRWRLPARAALVLVVAVQALCTLFFVWDILAGVVGLPRRPLSWRMREMMEMGAGVGLVLGVALGAVLLFTTLRQNRSMETQLRQASGAFAELLEERFRAWGLTPSERDVAWFTIKGLLDRRHRPAAADERGHGEGAVERHLPQGGGERAGAARQPLHRGSDRRGAAGAGGAGAQVGVRRLAGGAGRG